MARPPSDTAIAAHLQHEDNLSTLHSLEASSTSPPPQSSSFPPPPASASPASPASTNPLLQRKKLTKAKPSGAKGKKKGAAAAKTPAVAATIEQVKQSELDLISTGQATGEDGTEVLDLADLLLEQMGPDDGAEGQEEIQKSTNGDGEAKDESTFSAVKDKIKESLSPTPPEEKKVSRQQARKLKKASHFDAMRASAQAEVEAANDNSIKEEAADIEKGCVKLGVKLKEIDPDGHCLYSAIADQANALGLTLTQRKETYSSTRYYAAHYMRGHPDDFLPFLPSEDESGDGIMTPAEYEKYCATVESTAEWGGMPEINALSKYFKSPIWVLQAGTDLVKVGDEWEGTGRGPMLISYHRKMYGLGEHYNSLRK
ncbi:hypothetical protein MNV49_000323 [Pseudohyphozyma bogoriensis]|nr:hypothetical protein MNV49_000323 [Pseudohyphozyma bogoriensis]